MSMTTYALMRAEGNFTSDIKDAKLIQSVESAQIEIEKIIDSLTFLIIDFAYLQTADKSFSQDNGDSYKFTYTQISYLAKGYDSPSDSDYLALIGKINDALDENGQDDLTDADKLNLRMAGRDFRKAEGLIACSYFAITGNLRGTNEGGFTQNIMIGSGQTTIMTLDDAKKLSDEFRRRAMSVIESYISSKADDLDYVSGGGLSISAIPPKSTIQTMNTNPRERYSGDPSPV